MREYLALLNRLKEELPHYEQGGDAFRRWNDDRSICAVVAPFAYSSGLLTIEFGFYCPFVAEQATGQATSTPDISNCRSDGVEFRLEFLLKRDSASGLEWREIQVLQPNGLRDIAEDLFVLWGTVDGWITEFSHLLANPRYKRRGYALSWLGYLYLLKGDVEGAKGTLHKHKALPRKQQLEDHISQLEAELSARSA